MHESMGGRHSTESDNGTGQGIPGSSDCEAAGREQTVSVCMATWNGSIFLPGQLGSILPQLNSEDELVVVDDGSSDATMRILQQTAAEASHTRVRIYRNDENRGVIRTFERALALAEKDLVFLSDQDDLWFPAKISKIKGVFAAHPEITLVLSDTQIIDGSGAVTAESWRSRRPFHAGAIANLVRNTFLGCTMAFRRSSLEYCLPFPSGTPMHDQWIGTLHSLFGGVTFLPEPLMQYRRHEANATDLHRASVVQMLQWRFSLSRNLAVRCWHHWRSAHTSY